jgi:hypothetical protein
MYYDHALSSDDESSMALVTTDQDDAAPSMLDLMITVEEELGCSVFEALRSYRDDK